MCFQNTGAAKTQDKYSYSIPKGNIRKEERGNRSLPNPKFYGPLGQRSSLSNPLDRLSCPHSFPGHNFYCTLQLSWIDHMPMALPSWGSGDGPIPEYRLCAVVSPLPTVPSRHIFQKLGGDSHAPMTLLDGGFTPTALGGVCLACWNPGNDPHFWNWWGSSNDL